jgi:hypothetical protein
MGKAYGESRSLRDLLTDDHPVVGEGYRLLKDHEVLQEGDQSGHVSCLVSLTAWTNWADIHEGPHAWSEGTLGSTVGDVIKNDFDGHERVFRRAIPQKHRVCVMFDGKGCLNCPFFRESLTPDGDVEEVWCVLDGWEDDVGNGLIIDIGMDRKRRGNCPFMQNGPGRIEVKNHE